MPAPVDRRLRGALSLADFEARARRLLPRSIYAFAASGAETESSLRSNKEAFARWTFMPRALVDVSSRSQAVRLFGREYASPFGVAPMGGAAVCAYEADLALARAAAAAGVPFVLSGASTTPVEKVMREAPGTWFQAYLSHDEEKIAALLSRIEKAGVETLVVTVDVPVMGARENALRAGFSMPPRLSAKLVFDGLAHPRWMIGTLARTLLRNGVPYQENFEAERGPSILAEKPAPADRRSRLSWTHLTRIRKQWRGHLLLKGIVSPEDAALARSHGVDGVIISNHGGRQLDGAIAPLDALPAIIAETPDMPVLIDGGVMRGGDVLKALALGARMAMLGRPFLYAAAVGGEAGVGRAAEILRTEIDRTLALLGCPDIAGIGVSFLKEKQP